MRKLEDVIEEASKIHSNKYIYKEIFKENNTQYLLVECNTHGEFKQSYKNHCKKGRGCPECGKLKVLNSVMSRRISEEEFKERLKKYPDIYYESIYTKYSEKQVFICKKHGEFTKTPKNLIKSGCLKCKVKPVDTEKNKQLFLSKINKDWEIDYSLMQYKNMHTKTTFVCKVHGEFMQTPSSHLKTGCPLCDYNFEKKFKERADDFLSKFRSISNDCYQIPDLYNNYVSDKIKVTVVCNKHGEFKAFPGNLLKGSFCPECVFDNRGWSYSAWENQALNSKNFESYKVYVFDIKLNDEKFFKVGKTFRSIDFRIKDIQKSKYEVLRYTYKEFDNSFDASVFESYIKGELKAYKYTPRISFGGKRECFLKFDNYEEIFFNFGLILPPPTGAGD